MNDLYKEIMVKPRPSQTNALKKGLLIAAAVLVLRQACCLFSRLSCWAGSSCCFWRSG